jgi:hypothetical protein
MQIIDYENLKKAYLKAEKVKRFRHEAGKFAIKLEENLIILQNELIWNAYQSIPFKDCIIYYAVMQILINQDRMPGRDERSS